MIIFVGTQSRGYFLTETAKHRGESVAYVEENLSILKQRNQILKENGEYIIFDIEQYTDASDVLADEIKKLVRAKGWEAVIYAPGYDPDSRIIKELQLAGIVYFVFSSLPGEAGMELERCLQGYYDDPDEEKLEQLKEKEEVAKPGIRIGVTGATARMGTTTFALQFVKYLQLKGHKTCYIQVNNTGFVEQNEEAFNDVIHDPELGKVTFEHVDMYYRQENLVEIFKQGYDYYVYDFGTYSDNGFNKTSFLEKDIRIFVLGSKASEMDATMNVLRNEYYTEVDYVYNFVSESEKKDVLEMMEEKAARTYFTVYTPNQFEYVYNPAFEKLLPVEDCSEQKPQKKRLFFGRKKKGNRAGKAETDGGRS